MEPTDYFRNCSFRAAYVLCGCGWFAVFLVCGAMPGRANELVVPLVTPLIVPESSGNQGAQQEDRDFGFSDKAEAPPAEEADPIFGEMPDLSDDQPIGTPDLFSPLFGGNDVSDTPTPAATDINSISERENAMRRESDIMDPLAAFGRAPALGDSWLSGFDSGFGIGPFSSGAGIDSLRQGLGLALSMTGTYDSNPSRGYTTAEDDGSGDFSLMLGGGISYRSRASTWTYGATYTGGYRSYFNQTDLSGYSQNAGASIHYSGGPLTAVLAVGLDFGSGANRDFEAVTDTLNANYSLNARYLVSSKTALQSDFSQSYTLASGQGNLDTNSFETGLSALWKYSPLTEIGPGIRYTHRSQDSGPVRATIGPSFLVNYHLARKVTLNSRVGMDFSSIEGADSQDPSFSTSVGLGYRASELWGLNLSLLRDSRASNTAVSQFEEVTALRFGYTRQIRNSSWALGIGWESTTVESNSSGGVDSPDRDYFTIDASFGMPIFRGSTQARVFCGYRDENGSTSSSDSFQVGFGLSRTF